MSNILIKKTVISLDDLEKYISNDTQTINSLQNNFDIKQYIQKLYKYATFFVAYSDSQIIGMLCGYFNNFITKEAYISYLSILKPFQRKNVGTLLLKEAYTYAKKQGFKNISLEVLKNNLAGILFYKKNHYAIKNENENSFIMYRKVLPFNILITGANGILAKKLIEKFNDDDNYKVIASSRNIPNLLHSIL